MYIFISTFFCLTLLSAGCLLWSNHTSARKFSECKISDSLVYKHAMQDPDFLSSLLSFAPSMNKRLRRRLLRFLVYYLAEKGYIRIEFSQDNGIILLNNAVSSSDSAENYYINKLFNGVEDYYYTNDSIAGAQYVALPAALPQLSAFHPVKTNDNTNPQVEDRRAQLLSSEILKAKVTTVIIMMISILPNAYAEASGDIAEIIGYYIVWAILLIPFGMSAFHIVAQLTHTLKPYKIYDRVSEDVRTILDYTRHIIAYIAFFVCTFFAYAYITVFALSPGYQLIIWGFILVSVLWIITIIGCRIKYIKTPTELRHFTLYLESLIDSPSLEQRLSYFMLFKGKKETKKLICESMNSNPTWTNATSPSQLEQLNDAIDSYSRRKGY